MLDLPNYAASAGASVAARLPAEPNSFVGRERDLADLTMLLADVRMLTLCGPGGVGKTRLASKLASQLAAGFADGAWLVELADTRDPAMIGLQVAATLGIRPEPDRPVTETLADTLRRRHQLLVLDTCEHLVDEVAELASGLLGQCPQLRIVATSTVPLRLRGEAVWRVQPLALPPGGLPTADEIATIEAVQLFVDRATAVRPLFTLGPHNAAAVSRVCRTLDGIPLAIELAAARMRALSAEQLAARLDDRFRLLSGADPTAPLRQQTLRSAVDWSHDLLTGPEQVLLRRLSVFAGWHLEMAEQVAADELVPQDQVLELLAALIDKSLVTLDGEADGAASYRLLDTIRHYAAGRLTAAGEDEVIRRRHLDYMLKAAEAVVDRAFRRGDPPRAERVALYRQMARQLPNFRGALETALDYGLTQPGLRLCCALRSPWVVYGDVTEGAAWFDRFLAGPDSEATVDTPLRVRALTLRAELAFEQQDYAGAATAAQAAADLCTGLTGSSGAQRLLGLVSLRGGEPDQALAQVQAAVDAARADGDEWGEGLGLTAWATVLARLGRLDEAASTFEVALSVLADNNPWGVAHALYGSGSLARARQDNRAAVQYFRSALELFTEIDARTEMARCLAGIGWVMLAAGDLGGAAASLSQSLQLSVETGQRLGIARGLDAMAALAAASGEPEIAVRLEGASGPLRDAVGPARSSSAQQRLDAVLAAARSMAGAQNAQHLLAEGSRMPVHEAVSLALALADKVAILAPGIPVREAPPEQILTAREREIADLIARGLSNRAIATELVISPATAARHVANIFAKLGVTSRAQVAAWTAEHGPQA
jgi:predicted ATPase/DNA-binding CsgD family transcriptional regulator/Tfp pilus assembly protein PilF